MRAQCLLAGKRHDGARLLQKALDRLHRVAVNQFVRAKTPTEVRALWQGARRCGSRPPEDETCRRRHFCAAA